MFNADKLPVPVIAAPLISPVAATEPPVTKLPPVTLPVAVTTPLVIMLPAVTFPVVTCCPAIITSCDAIILETSYVC